MSILPETVFKWVFYYIFGTIGLIIALAPLMELERRINEIRLRRWHERKRSIKELEKLMHEIKPDWHQIEPEVRLDLMAKVLKSAGQTELAKQVEAYEARYNRPWWKTWSLLPIAVFNAAVFSAAMYGASQFGGWIYLWTALGTIYGLVVLNGIMCFESGCDQIPQWHRYAAQEWMPQGKFTPDVSEQQALNPRALKELS